jgi:hypothetical protein
MRLPCLSKGWWLWSKLWNSRFEKECLSLALMGTASSYGGVRHKRYSVQQEQWFLRIAIVVLHKTKKAPVLQLMLS